MTKKRTGGFMAALERVDFDALGAYYLDHARDGLEAQLESAIADHESNEYRADWTPNQLAERREIWRVLGAACFRSSLARIHHAAWLTRSPIEEQFLYGLIAAASTLGSPLLVVREGMAKSGQKWRETKDLTLDDSGLDYTKYEVLPQHAHGKMHPDFTVRCSTYAHIDREHFPAHSELVVELDGHDFHERTKEQASRDKRRDRDLSAIGVPVIRFSGSDIYKDPIEHAAWTLMHAFHLAMRPAVDAAFRKDFNATADWYSDIRASLLERDTGLDLKAWKKRLKIEGGE
jgi:hypothetical protein